MRKRRLLDFTYVRHEHRQSYQLACILFMSLLMFMGISNFVIGSVEVLGQSMAPHLRDGDRRLFHRWAYWFDSPQLGEVVVVEDPETESLAVKRVVGLPRDTIELNRGTVWVNGIPLDEPYLRKEVETWPSQKGVREYIVPADSFFLLGDNRLWSADSRIYGPVKEARILGKVGH